MKPKQILILGGGAFTLPTALLHEYPDLQLDIVEIDGELEEIAKKHFGFKPTGKTQVYAADGSRFVAKSDQTYDMIIIDVFDDVSIPANLQTAAFVQNLRRRLKPHGLVAINIIGSLRGLRSRSIRTLHQHWQDAFPVVEIFPATTGLSSWLPQNYVLIGQDGSWDTSTYLTRSPIELPLL